MSSGTSRWPGWLSHPNAAAEWLAESDSDAGQSVSRASPSWAAPARTTSVRTFGPKADCRLGSSGLGRDDSWQKGQTRNSNTVYSCRNLPEYFWRHSINRGICKQQVLAFVLFHPPARPGGSFPAAVPAAQPGLSVHPTPTLTRPGRRRARRAGPRPRRRSSSRNYS